MPKYRKLHTCTLDSLDLAAMPDDFTRLTWLMLPLIMSRDGTTLDHSHYLRSKLYPLRDDVTVEMVEGAIAWFKTKGMIQGYCAEGRDYLWIPTWPKFQGTSDKEAPSTFPTPPAVQSESVPTPGLVQSESVPTPAQCSVVQIQSSSSVDVCTQEQIATTAATGEVFKAWESARGGAINQMDGQEIGDLVNTYTAPWVLEAIKEANKSRQDKLPSIKFLDVILQRWKREGFKAPFDAKANRAKALKEQDGKKAKANLDSKLERWNREHGIEQTDV